MKIFSLLVFLSAALIAADPFDGEWHSSGKDSVGRTFMVKQPGTDRAMGKIGIVFDKGKLSWIQDYNKEGDKRDFFEWNYKILDATKDQVAIRVESKDKAEFWIITKEKDDVIEVNNGWMKLVMIKK